MALLPDVGHHVRIEVPEAEAAIEKFVVVVTDSGCTAESLQSVEKLCAEPFRGVRTVLGDVEKDLLEVGSRFRSESK